MRKMIIFGTGELAMLADYYFSRDGRHSVAALTVDGKYLTEENLWGRPVVPFEAVERLYPPAEYDLFVAVGYSDMNRGRENKCAEALAKGYTLVSYISDKAHIANTFTHGYNCFILENNIIQPHVAIGNNVILLCGNLLGHRDQVADHCFLTSNVTVCGQVTIGDHCFLGVTCCIRDKVSIAPYTLVGACAYIAHDTKEGEVYIAEATKPSRRVSSEVVI